MWRVAVVKQSPRKTLSCAVEFRVATLVMGGVSADVSWKQQVKCQYISQIQTTIDSLEIILFTASSLCLRAGRMVKDSILHSESCKAYLL